jgi:hypothetical protein
MIIFYCLRFETPPTWRARSPYLYPPGKRWPSYTPRHWVPFSSPPTTCRATVEVFEPDSTRGTLNNKLLVLVIYAWHGLHRKYFFHYCVFSLHWGNSVPTEMFPSNGCSAVASLHSNESACHKMFTELHWSCAKEDIYPYKYPLFCSVLTRIEM